MNRTEALFAQNLQLLRRQLTALTNTTTPPHTIAEITGLPAELDAKVDRAALPETIDDRVAAFLAAGSNVALTYDDATNTLTISVNSTVTVIENRTDDPPSPAIGQIWLRTDF